MPWPRSLRAHAPGRPSLDRTARIVLFITLAGFVLRVAWVVVAARTPAGIHDPVYYLAYAERIAGGHGYTTPDGAATAYYPVGYPAVLAVAVWLARRLPGDHVIGAGLALNVLAGTASIAMAAALARRVAGSAAAIGAAAVLAFLPNLVLHTGVLLTETVFVTVLLGALLVLCWRPWGEAWSARRTAGAAALVAGAALVRPVALVLVPVVVGAWLLAERRSVAAVARRSALLVGVVVVLLAPWLARSWSATGRLTLAASTGDNLCIGNNPDATGAFALPPSCFDGLAPELYITGTDDRDRRQTDKALTWARSHLTEEPALVFWRTYYTFEHDHDAVAAVQSYGDDPWLGGRTAQLLSTASDAAYWVVLGAAVAGGAALLARRGRDARATFLLATAGALTVVVWPFFGDTRFHVPVLAVLAVPAGWALATAAGALRR